MILQNGGEISCGEIADAGSDRFECSTTMLGPFIFHCAMGYQLVARRKDSNIAKTIDHIQKVGCVQGAIERGKTAVNEGRGDVLRESEDTVDDVNDAAGEL